ncbi:MAG: hypothetical protein ACK4UN_04100 [Limisphaerales bacterium]
MDLINNRHFSIGLKPNGEVSTRHVNGTYFICTDYDSTEPFLIALNGGDFFPWQMGLKMRLPAVLTQIQLKQEGSEERRIEFYVGNVDIEDSRLNIITAKALLVSNQAAPTGIVAGPEVLLAEQTLTRPGALNSGGLTRRKSIIITNLSDTLSLQVLNNANQVVATILPEMAWGPVETDATIKIRQPQLQECPLNICEIFYKL